MLTIGLCGGSGSGKNEVQAAFARLGIEGLDTDALYHRLIDGDTPLARALAERFGKQILKSGGGVNRIALRDIVFSKGAEADLADLNAITHAAVLNECRAWLEAQRKAGAFAALINAPLLFESGFDAECDLTVAVLAPKELRILRIMARDGLTREDAARRICAQREDALLAESTTYQIHNSGTEDELFRSVRLLCDRIKKLAEDK